MHNLGTKLCMTGWAAFIINPPSTCRSSPCPAGPVSPLDWSCSLTRLRDPLIGRGGRTPAEPSRTLLILRQIWAERSLTYWQRWRLFSEASSSARCCCCVTFLRPHTTSELEILISSQHKVMLRPETMGDRLSGPWIQQVCISKPSTGSQIKL